MGSDEHPGPCCRIPPPPAVAGPGQLGQAWKMNETTGLNPLVASGAALILIGVGYWVWVVHRTEGIYTGISLERLRYAHMSDQQRLRLTCLGARAALDAARGHARDHCLQFLQEANLAPGASLLNRSNLVK